MVDGWGEEDRGRKVNRGNGRRREAKKGEGRSSKEWRGCSQRETSDDGEGMG